MFNENPPSCFVF